MKLRSYFELGRPLVKGLKKLLSDAFQAPPISARPFAGTGRRTNVPADIGRDPRLRSQLNWA